MGGANRFAWQDEFFQSCQGWLSDPSKPNYFCCVLPGGGKTRGSGRVAKKWIENGGIIAVTGPTLIICRQWRDSLREHFGINLDENFTGPLREGYHGPLLTYAGVSGAQLLLKRLSNVRPLLLIADEIHHASEGEHSEWGLALKDAFSLAKKRLLLSGTPVRSDKETTNFLEIEFVDDGTGLVVPRYKMDFCFDWPRALEDRVVRKVSFQRIAMETVKVTYPDGGVRTFSQSDDSYLNYALDRPELLTKTLREANECLSKLRQADPSAAALAVAKNITHASKLFEILRMLGEKPQIVHSKLEEKSLDIIKAFTDDISRRWLISVQQVSEGADIPRCRVEAYLTNISTNLAFRQLAGRAVRRRENENDANATAHVFIPDVPELVKHAEEIERLQELAMKKPTSREGGLEPPKPGVATSGSDVYHNGFVIGGQRYEGGRGETIRSLMERYHCSEVSAAIIFDDNLAAAQNDFQNKSATSDAPPWEKEALLKIEINSLANRIVRRRIETEFGEEATDQNIFAKKIQALHYNVNCQVGCRQMKDMSISQLEQKKSLLVSMLGADHEF